MKFDPLRASFYLVALVISLHGVVVLLGYVGCLVWFQPDQGGFECDKSGRLTEMLAAALAASLAFVGGFTRRGEKNGDQQ